MAGKYVAPSPSKEAFTCPHCETLATQHNEAILVLSNRSNNKISRCSICHKDTLWIVRQAMINGEPKFENVMVYPTTYTTPAPNEDLSEDVRADYEEAQAVFGASPRSAAALLRLAIQKLCKELGEPGRNINDDIGSLVAKGMSSLIQQAMDTVRIAGNESVHPGELNLNDDQDIALGLFDLVNIIAMDRLTTPRMVRDMYELMPEAKRQAIEQRDGAK